VTELNARTGVRIRNLPRSRKYGFNGPAAITSNNTFVWVVSENHGYSYRVSKLQQRTGALLATLDSSRYGFDAPDAISLDRARVWVSNLKSQSVTEFPAS